MSDFGLQGMLYELIFLSLYMCGAVPSCSVVFNSLGPIDCSPRGSSVHGMLQARILEWVSMPFSKDLSNPGIELAFPGAPTLQVDSLPHSHQGSPFP